MVSEGLSKYISTGPCRKLIPPHKEKRKSFGNGVTERNEIKVRQALLPFFSSFIRLLLFLFAGVIRILWDQELKGRNLRDQTSCTAGRERERERVRQEPEVTSNA